MNKGEVIETLEDWEKRYPEMFKIVHEILAEHKLENLIFRGIHRYSPLLISGTFDIEVSPNVFRQGFDFTCNADGDNLKGSIGIDDGMYHTYEY